MRRRDGLVCLTVAVAWWLARLLANRRNVPVTVAVPEGYTMCTCQTAGMRNVGHCYRCH